MTILEHLQELRRRITIALVAVLIAATISFLFTDNLLVLLLEPAKSRGIEIIAIAPAETLTTYIKSALIIGVALASPIVLSQIILFIAPGLTATERRVLYTVLPLAIVFFFLGVLFCFYLVLPQALRSFSASAPTSPRPCRPSAPILVS
jgi:sec-independent protein translocase protein TatC